MRQPRTRLQGKAGSETQPLVSSWLQTGRQDARGGAEVKTEPVYLHFLWPLSEGFPAFLGRNSPRGTHFLAGSRQRLNSPFLISTAPWGERERAFFFTTLGHSCAPREVP